MEVHIHTHTHTHTRAHTRMEPPFSLFLPPPSSSLPSLLLGLSTWQALKFGQDACGLDSAALLVPYLLWPIAEDVYADFFKSVKHGLVVELSHQGQLYRMLRMQLDLPRGLKSFCRSGANPFQPSEIAARLTELKGMPS